MRLKSLTVGGLVEGSGSKTRINIATSGDIVIESTGKIGANNADQGQKGSGVTLTAEGKTTVSGEARGGPGSTFVNGKGGVTVTSGGSITSTGSTTFVRSKEGPVVVGGTVSSRNQTSVVAGPGDRVVIETTGTVEATFPLGDVLINPEIKPPGSVLVNGTICARDEVCIWADTLFINGTIKCKKFTKTAKFVVFGPNGKIKGPSAIERNIRSKDKVLTEEDLSDRSGIDPGTDSDDAKVVGEPSSIIDLRNAPLAFAAVDAVTIATGLGGTIDLRENPPGTPVVDSPGPILIKADTVLLDPGVAITDLMGPGPVTQLPSGDQAAVGAVSVETGIGYAGRSVDVTFLVGNLGNFTDTYSIAIADSAGWGFVQSDVMVTLDSVGEADSLITVTLDVPPSAIPGVDKNRVGIEVTSQSDPSESASDDTLVEVRPDTDFYWASHSWYDSENEQPGDVSDVEFILRNEGDEPDVYTIIVTDSLGWSFTPPPSPVALAPAESTIVVLQATVPSGATVGDENAFYFDAVSIGDPTEALSDTARVNVRLPHVQDHDVGNMRLTMTDRGTLGFEDMSQSVGSGLEYPIGTPNALFIGSLWVSEDHHYIANRDYEADPAQEWRTSLDPDGVIKVVGPDDSDQDIVGGLDATDEFDPFGFYIRQESWAFSEPNQDDFIIVRYFIHNRSLVDEVADVRVGLYLDFDIATATDDSAGTDTSRQTAYVTDGSTFYGARLLQDPGSTSSVSNVTLVENPRWIYPQNYMLDTDKLGFLSGSAPDYVVTATDSLSDYSILVSAGPFTIAAGDSQEVAFAVVGGLSLVELQFHADAALSTYLGLPVDVPPTDTGGGGLVRSLVVRPNPFYRTATIEYEVLERSGVTVSVFDVGGRLVRQLDAGPQLPGVYSLTWNGVDRTGRAAAAGVYFIRIRVGSNEMHQRLVKTHR